MKSTHRSSPSTQHCGQPGRLGPKRAAFQWLTTLAIIGTPFVQVRGESLLRLDFGTLRLHAFGMVFPIEQLSLFFLLCIALTLLFLLITLAFGRAWCGWACPQTTLVDLVEWLLRRMGVKVTAGAFKTNAWQSVLLQVIYVSLSLLVGANLVWYFVSPYNFFPQAFRGELHWAATLTVALTAVCVYLDLALLRRLFCKEFCPYGRFQSALVDPGTLVLHYHPDEAPRCIQCGACVRACPTGIDIRRGVQIECINCGRCLDACREVMARRQQPGIIRYTFGLEGKGLKALFNLRMGLVALACLGVLGALVVSSSQRAAVSLKVARSTTLLPRLLDEERVANFFTVYLANHSGTRHTIKLAIDSAPDVELKGSNGSQTLAPQERRRLDLAIMAHRETLASPRPVELVILDGSGESADRTTIYLTKPLEHHD